MGQVGGLANEGIPAADNECDGAAAAALAAVMAVASVRISDNKEVVSLDDVGIGRGRAREGGRMGWRGARGRE